MRNSFHARVWYVCNRTLYYQSILIDDGSRLLAVDEKAQKLFGESHKTAGVASRAFLKSIALMKALKTLVHLWLLE